jgi:hypothetical protein
MHCVKAKRGCIVMQWECGVANLLICSSPELPFPYTSQSNSSLVWCFNQALLYSLQSYFLTQLYTYVKDGQ